MRNRILISLSKSSLSFTLIELIVVIIIVGILAAVGLSQYSLTVEKARTAEAKIRIGAMRQLAYEYWLNNGTLATITNADVGATDTCSSTDFYRYSALAWTPLSGQVWLSGYRCTSGGKTPNTTRAYYYFMVYYPGTTGTHWACYYVSDGSPCFGLPGG